ncbi:MAG TPA: SURF1 family protein [Gemmatimonadaceae bacterium]|nr:SURF1 family protein [Gemmatimonadaceae bacterium]
MLRRNVIASVVVIAIAAVFARLGVWQLHRLTERRARNAEVAARTRIAPVSLAELPADTARDLYRHVRVTGVYDYPRQFAVIDRTLNGSPGVDIFTPLRIPGSSRAVLVNRGWVYSPDASSVDLARWRERDTVTINGFVEEFRPIKGLAEMRDPQQWRELDAARVARTIPYPVEPYYVVVLPDSGPQDPASIARLSPPPLNEGPHKSYAIQWFSFAAIALFGLVLLWRPADGRGVVDRRREKGEQEGLLGKISPP